APRGRSRAARARPQGGAARHPAGGKEPCALTDSARMRDEPRVRLHAVTLLAASVLLLLVRDSDAVAPACAPGRFIVAGSPLVTPGRTNAQALVLTSTDAAISGACAPTGLKMKPRKRGTIVKARWGSLCGGLRLAVLSATIDAASCNTMKGTLRIAYARGKLRPPRWFTATRAAAV